jgi:hypothetical protein
LPGTRAENRRGLHDRAGYDIIEEWGLSFTVARGRFTGRMCMLKKEFTTRPKKSKKFTQGNIYNTAVILGHESYRDGVEGIDNITETRQAVLAHTRMAINMSRDGKSLSYNKVLNRDIFEYLKANSKNGNKGSFNGYVDENYDSSKDFWKVIVKKDGTYKMEDDHSDDITVVTEIDGVEKILAFFQYQGGRRTGFIAETLGISREEVNYIMGTEYGWTFEKDTWTNDGKTDGVVRFGTEVSQRIAFPLSEQLKNYIQTMLGTGYDLEDVRVRYVYTTQSQQDLQQVIFPLVQSFLSQADTQKRIGKFITDNRPMSLPLGVSAGISGGMIYFTGTSAADPNAVVHEFFHQVQFHQDIANFERSLWEQLTFDDLNSPGVTPAYDVYDYTILGSGKSGTISNLTDLVGRSWGPPGLADNRGIEAQAQFWGEFADNYYSGRVNDPLNKYTTNQMAEILYRSGYRSPAIFSKTGRP